jgi:hypothetical protein
MISRLYKGPLCEPLPVDVLLIVETECDGDERLGTVDAPLLEHAVIDAAANVAMASLIYVLSEPLGVMQMLQKKCAWLGVGASLLMH